MITRRHLLHGLTTAATLSAFAGDSISAPNSSNVHGFMNTPSSANIKRGVSLYSYQEEFYTRAMTLEDCLAEASSIGAYGIEMLPEEMVPGFPNPGDKWIDFWFSINQKHNTIPVTYTQFQDTYLTPNHDLTTDEGVRMMERDLRLAKRLGFKNLRLLIGTPLDVIERSIPLAEQLDMRMNVEIHAPCPIDGPLVHRWVEIIEKHKTTHFGLNPDMGLFVEREERIDRDRRIRDGQVREKVAHFVDKAHEEKMPKNHVRVELQQMSAPAR